MVNRNIQGLFFKVSGFKPEEADDIVYRTKQVKEVLKQQKRRKRLETRVIHLIKNVYKMDRAEKNMIKRKHEKPTKQEKISGQIQYGFDLAAWWRMQHE